MSGDRWQDVEPVRERYDNEVPAASFGGDWILDGAVWDMEESEPWDSDEYEGMGLTDRERDVLNCRIQAGHTVRETGRLLNMPKSTVANIEYVALIKVRKFLEAKNEQN